GWWRDGPGRSARRPTGAARDRLSPGAVPVSAVAAGTGSRGAPRTTPRRRRRRVHVLGGCGGRTRARRLGRPRRRCGRWLLEGDAAAARAGGRAAPRGASRHTLHTHICALTRRAG